MLSNQSAEKILKKLIIIVTIAIAIIMTKNFY